MYPTIRVLFGSEQQAASQPARGAAAGRQQASQRSNNSLPESSDYFDHDKLKAAAGSLTASQKRSSSQPAIHPARRAGSMPASHTNSQYYLIDYSINIYIYERLMFDDNF